MVILNKFPNKTELERIETLRKYRKLYENNQMVVLGIHDIIKNQYKNVADLVYLAHSVPARITEFYGDFVQGDVERMSIQVSNGSQADQEWVDGVVYENDIKEKINDYAEDQSEFGFVVFLGYVDSEGVYHIQTVGSDQYFPQADGSVVFATYKTDPEDPDSKRFLLHTQHYQIKDGKVVIEHQAFRTNEQGVAVETYSLEAMSKLVGRELKETEEIDGLDELPIRQADNGRRTKWGFGKSDYHDILPQLAEINERVTHASTQFLKNLDAKMVVPASAYEQDEETGESKLKHKEVFIADGKEDVTPTYIINQNPLISEVREHVMGELKFIEWTTAVPMWALTKGSAPERVESLRIQLFGALRKSKKKQAKIRRALLDMFRIGAKMTGQSEDLQQKDLIIEFSDPLPVDEMAQVQTESEKIRSGISSRSSAMKRVENYTDEQVAQEQEKIKAEDQIAGIGNANNAPTL